MLRIVIASTKAIKKGTPLILDYNQFANTYFDEKMSDEDKERWKQERMQSIGPWIGLGWQEQNAFIAPQRLLKRRLESSAVPVRLPFLLSPSLPQDSVVSKRRRRAQPIVAIGPGESAADLRRRLLARVRTYGIQAIAAKLDERERKRPAPPVVHRLAAEEVAASEAAQVADSVEEAALSESRELLLPKDKVPPPSLHPPHSSCSCGTLTSSRSSAGSGRPFPGNRSTSSPRCRAWSSPMAQRRRSS